MSDRTKIIEGLEEAEIMLSQAVDRGGEMAMLGAFKCRSHVSDAIALLLEEQEAVKPKLVGPSMWRCGKCDELLGWEEFARSGVELVEYKFCPGCGRQVKWNEN